MATVLDHYEALKKAVKRGLLTPDVRSQITGAYEKSIAELEGLERVDLQSVRMPDKSYFVFKIDAKRSRAINSALFEASLEAWKEFCAGMDAGDLTHRFDAATLNKIMYNVAITFSAVVDLTKTGDQKTPGTFFEYFIAHIYAWRVGVEPKRSIQILHLDDEDTELPTDFVFNLGKDRPKFHMPIKTSTRERSIMLWAHQKLLDGVFGIERFMGTPVLLSETKVDSKKLTVEEICLPDQWRLYQLYIAKLRRIYYLDPPAVYAKLADNFPPLKVTRFGDFLSEWDSLAGI